MSLEDKRILIFAAYGAISREVAAQAVMQRAEVFLSGRDPVQLAALKSELQGLGGRVHTDVVDASEADAVRTYIDRVVSTGRIDATFNGIGLRAAAAAYGTPSPKLILAKFLLPLEVHVGSSFLTSSIVGEAMSKMGGGSIVILSASLSGAAVPFMAGITAACGAIEAMTRSLAGEFGASGVRVNCVRATAMRETRTIQETNALFYAAMGVPPPENPNPENLLAKHITVEDTAGAVLFLMSHAASGMTGQVVNVCGGTLLV